MRPGRSRTLRPRLQRPDHVPPRSRPGREGPRDDRQAEARGDADAGDDRGPAVGRQPGPPPPRHPPLRLQLRPVTALAATSVTLIDTLGRWAAVPATLGLLLLLPLYLSQRRDIARLRVWMAREPNHPVTDLAASEALLDRAEADLGA